MRGPMKKLREVYCDLADSGDYGRGLRTGTIVGALIGSIGVLVARAAWSSRPSPDDRQLPPARGMYGPRAW